MRKKEFAARVWSKLMAFEKQQGLLKQGDSVLAAVSGGPDSVCLAHYLTQQSRRKSFKLNLLHIHHGLRGKAADADAAFVRKLGEGLGVNVKVIEVAVRERAQRRGKGLEDAARELRYGALEDCARKLGANKVATGHQLDDQAETVLLQLVRGSRLETLAGMAPRRALGDALLIRPLLPLSRADVLAYLEVHSLKHRVDRTNADPRFTRNWLRRRVLPLLAKGNPRIRERLSALAAEVRLLTAR